MKDDDSETINDVEDEEKNRILTTSVTKKITLCGSKHVILLKIGQGLLELSNQGGIMTPGHIYEDMFFSVIVMLTL